MAEVIGVADCPICSKEVKVKKNSNGKPGFYCGGPEGCKVQVQSSGGASQKFINAKLRPAKSEAVKSEEVKDGTVGQPKGDTGEQRKSDGGFFSKLFSGGEDD